jgi:uncharacterized protein (TIGR03000 family)
MSRTFLVLAVLTGLLRLTGLAPAQAPGKTVQLEIWVPENARLFIEGQETRATGALRRFESPPLPPGKYTYTLKAVVPGPKGELVTTRTVDVRPGDFEMVDLRPRPAGERVPDCRFEPTPERAVAALLALAKVTRNDVLWDLGSGDGRIPIAAAKQFGIKARGFELDPELVRAAKANAERSGVADLVTIEKRDIFTLDLSHGPTVVTLYLLPRLNAQLLPQLQKLPAGARVVSVAHRLADIEPDQQLTVDTEDGEFHLYLWRVETLKAAKE